ncbi:MAG: hypothetical protein BA864_05015 [Desulfuromonadales bacterium C00003093]|nr:MAG: hypothetical protein BA864_05015 [Desulfuromonadales bacterium C00003093]
MTFSEWYEKLPDDEKAALCSSDVWKGALHTANKGLKKEYDILMASKLPTVAAGVNISIEILFDLLKKEIP